MHANNYLSPAYFSFLLANHTFLPAIVCSARSNFEQFTTRFCNRFPLYL